MTDPAAAPAAEPIRLGLAVERPTLTAAALRLGVEAAADELGWPHRQVADAADEADCDLVLAIGDPRAYPDALRQRTLRVGVTGARGRVGSALVDELRRRGAEVIAWSRPDYDLDDPESAARVVGRDQPTLVYHSAAWTDVDGCARDPGLATRRNALATAELARACVDVGADLVYISTNEVFNGEREDGLGYQEDDPTEPLNPYGQSKALGEQEARSAFAGAAADAWVVRTSWVFGPPGNDFPARIIAAADALAQGAQLRVVGDEVGRPTSSRDLAKALVRLPYEVPSATYHLTSGGRASRFEWARLVIERCRPGVPIEEIRLADRPRASRPPKWAVLDTGRAEGGGLALRPWSEALADYLEEVCRAT